MDLKFELHERQGQAFATPASEVLFGGAKGGGKSFLLRAMAIFWALRCPGIQIYLFRRKYPDLIGNHMRGANNFHQMLAPLTKKKRCRIVGDKDIRFENGANIFLRHLQNENDVTNYQGIEIHIGLFDELTHFTEYQYRVMRTSVRLGDWKPPAMYRSRLPRIAAGTNPGGIGHHWVKNTFIDNGPYFLVQEPISEGGMLRQFIPARAEDNPDLLKNDPTYLDRLEGMGNAALVRAMREGDWSVVAGSMFGDKFRPTLHGKPWHVLSRAFAIPATWEIWRGGDDGFKSPASVHWLTRDPDVGTIYVIREIYKSGMLPDDFAKLTLRIDKSIRLDYGDGDYETNSANLTGIMDSAAFSDTGTGRKSRGAQMNEYGCRWTPIIKERDKTNEKSFRVMRVQLMHAMLMPNKRDPLLKPGIRIFPNCTELVRTLGTIPVDETDPEDVDTESEDHAFDSVTYGASKRKKFFARKKVRGI